MHVLIWLARHAIEMIIGWITISLIMATGLSWAITRGKRQQQMIPCVCGCPGHVHEHFRDGDDCGQCGKDICPGYRPARPTPGTTVHIDGDEMGRLITFRPDGHWGTAEPDVKSCRRDRG